MGKFKSPIINHNSTSNTSKGASVIQYNSCNPLERSVVSDATGLATSVQYAVVCERVETLMSFACNSSFLSVDGMTCLISFER